MTPEAGRPVRSLAEQAAAQQQRVAEGLRSLGDELRSMVELGGQSGLGSQLGQQASEQAHRMADWIGQRQPGEVLDEVRHYARRHPGVFLLGAAVVGVVAERLTRGFTSEASEDSGGSRAAKTSTDALTPEVPDKMEEPEASEMPEVLSEPEEQPVFDPYPKPELYRESTSQEVPVDPYLERPSRPNQETPYQQPPPAAGGEYGSVPPETPRPETYP
jgi:hypothetical protein